MRNEKSLPFHVYNKIPSYLVLMPHKTTASDNQITALTSHKIIILRPIKFPIISI